MQKDMATSEWTIELGDQLRLLRLRQNIDQRQLASHAGIALNAVKALESGKGATIGSLVKVLRVLGRADWLLTLSPPVNISPIQLARNKKIRKRVSPQRTRKSV